MKTTTNYSFNVIELTDSPPDIGVESANWNVLDAKLKEIEDGGVSVTDSLESTSIVDALSANQGKVLKGLVDELGTSKAESSDLSLHTSNSDIHVTVAEKASLISNKLTIIDSSAAPFFLVSGSHVFANDLDALIFYLPTVAANEYSEIHILADLRNPATNALCFFYDPSIDEYNSNIVSWQTAYGLTVGNVYEMVIRRYGTSSNWIGNITQINY